MKTDIDFNKILMKGEVNAISAAQLCIMLDVSDPRTIRHIIHRAREKGQIICSSNAGYFLPATREEIDAWVRKTIGTISSLSKSALPASNRLVEIEGQQSLNFDEVEQ